MMRKSSGAQLQLDIGIAGRAESADTVTALPCDRWIATSAMQKAIRRGDVVTAQRAALTQFNSDSRTVWRRLIIVAAEDVGIGSVDAVIETTRLASDPRMRHQLGGEEAAIFHACRRLAEAPKDRSSDHLVTGAAYDPGLEAAREECGSNPVAGRLEFVADQTRSLPERAVAAWYASGIENGRERRVGKGDFDGLMKVYADLGARGPLLDAVRIAARKTREPIVILLPLLWLAIADETPTIDNTAVPQSTYVNDVPTYALDGHTRLGRQAIATFARTEVDIARFLSRHVPDFRGEKALRLAVFFADSAMIRPRLCWRQAGPIERLGIDADFASINVTPVIGSELTELVRQNLARLNAIRADILAHHQRGER
jgi:hypothetical protein